jgi:hypothetical protein
MAQTASTLRSTERHIDGEQYRISVYRDAVIPDVDARVETIRVATEESWTWDVVGGRAHLQSRTGCKREIPEWAATLLDELGVRVAE